MRLVLVLALLLAGCAGNVDSSSWSRIYSKPNVTAEQQQNDALDCVPMKAKIFNAWVVDFGQKDHEMCMAGKGYTVKTSQ
jgi:PBP1b-binding outer membrane lipoprotein LpoB